MRTASLSATPEAKTPPGTRRARYGVKVLLALLALFWLLGMSGWRNTVSCLRGLHPRWLLLGLATYLLGQSLSAWKWSVLGESLGFRRPFSFYWVNYLGAMFPSLFLPTSIGGDVCRAVVLARPPDGQGAADGVGATVSVLADRGTGMLGLAWIAAAAAAIGVVRIPPLATRAILAFAAMLTAGFAAPFFLSLGQRERIAARFKKGFWLRVLSCWDHPSALAISVLVAVCFNALVAAIYAMLGRGLELPVPVGFYFLLAPLVSVAALSPITINGVGERSVALVVLFRLVGVAREQAVALGLAWTALVAIAALAGGVILFLSDRNYHAPEV